jgi:hypothetical protein
LNKRIIILYQQWLVILFKVDIHCVPDEIIPGLPLCAPEETIPGLPLCAPDEIIPGLPDCQQRKVLLLLL